MDDVEEVPVGQLHGRLFGQVQAPVTTTPAPLPNPVAQPAPSVSNVSIGKAPPEPKVKTPDAAEVGKQAAIAGNAAKKDQKPADTPSALSALGNELVKNWWVAPLAVLGHQIITKTLGENEKPKATPIESRKIGAGQQMNVNTGEPRMVGDLFPADVSTKPTGPTPENPTVDLNTKINNKPSGFNLVEESEKNKLKNELAKEKQTTTDATVKSFERDAKGNIKYPEGMTPAAKAGAEAFAAQYPDQAKAFASKGQFGILGAGSSMNSLYNTWGENVAKQLRNELVSGNLLGGAQEYPGMLSKIAAIPPESATGKQLADIREKNPKGGTHGVLGKSVTMQEGKLIEGKNKVPGIVAKGIGPAVLLMSIADAAKAKSAREGAGVLAEGAFNALAPMGIAPSELAPSTLTEKQLNAYKEAQKLGSPYRSVPPPR